MKQNDLKRRRRAVRMVMTSLDLKMAEQRDQQLRDLANKSKISANNSIDN